MVCNEICMTAVEANEGKRPTEPLDPTKDNSRRRAGDDARRAYEENFAETMIADRSSQLPRFDLNEMSLGEVLGKGNFGTVLEIRKFECDEMKSSANSRHTEHRTFLQDNCIREDTQDARYAVKFVSHEVADNPESFRCAAYDLAVETRFLSVILHPNIVKLRAVASVSPFDERYFLIMDRLYDTLEKRLVEWKKSDIQHKRLLKDLDGSKQRALHQIRIIYAFDLSAALLYLHGHDILYRDLKPVNIGFDIRDDVKIFDFGTAAELRAAYRDRDGLFHLTGMTGSPRYMAPEVALSQPYNEGCDVYSFSLLLWEMLSLKIPYSGHTLESLRENVWQGKQERPKLDKSWSKDIKELLESSWTPNVGARWEMDQVKDMLKLECVRSRGGNSAGLEHIQRRSTFVFKQLSSSKDLGNPPGSEVASGSRWSNSIQKSLSAFWKNSVKNLAPESVLDTSLSHSMALDSIPSDGYI